MNTVLSATLDEINHLLLEAEERLDLLGVQTLVWVPEGGLNSSLVQARPGEKLRHYLGWGSLGSSRKKLGLLVAAERTRLEAFTNEITWTPLLEAPATVRILASRWLPELEEAMTEHARRLPIEASVSLRNLKNFLDSVPQSKREAT